MTISGFATAIALNPVNGMVYVTSNYDFGPEVVDIIDSATDTVVAINGAGFINPVAVATNPINGKAYVADRDANFVSIYDGLTHSLIVTTTVGLNPSALAVNPNTGKAYVSNQGDGTVSVLSGVTNAVIDTIAVGTDPKSLAINPVTNKIYVGNEGVVQLRSLTVILIH